MARILAFGEALIDFAAQAPSTTEQGTCYLRQAGGAPFNFAVACQRFGHETTFLGKVGADALGRFLLDTGRSQGLDMAYCIEDPQYFTTLAFVSLDAQGERDFSFARKPGADSQLRREEIDLSCLEGRNILHAGALSLSAEPCKTALEALATEARQRRLLISFDANYRAELWPSSEAYRHTLLAFLPFVDLLKVSREEACLLSGEEDPQLARSFLLSQGPRLLAWTDGEAGSVLQSESCTERLAARKWGKTLDTTAAGDCYFAALLSRLLHLPEPLQAGAAELRSAGAFAAMAAAISVTRLGGIASLPAEAEVLEALEVLG